MEIIQSYSEIIKSSRLKFLIQNFVDLYKNNFQDNNLTNNFQFESHEFKKEFNEVELLVTLFLNNLDRKDLDRENVIMLIIDMIRYKNKEPYQIMMSLKMVMELAPELICDVPKVYEYVAHYMSEYQELSQ
jgi:hypothetical protein